MVSSFHPHSMCKEVARVTEKTGCTSCTKQTISFEVSGFHHETRLLQRDFIFLNLFELLTLCVQNAPFKATSSIFNPFRLQLLFFIHLLIFLSYKTLKLKAFQINYEKIKVGMVSSFHPHSMCKNVERVTAETGCTSCTNWTIRKYQGFGRKLICYKGISLF